MAESRLNIRVDSATKEQAEKVFRGLGLTMSGGINVFLAKVVADRGIPFPLSMDRASEIGVGTYAFERAAVSAVRERITEMEYNAAPIARFDDEKGQPYLEYSSGRRDYSLED
jgi:addiction module RelB/DinJ family antitoxin